MQDYNIKTSIKTSQPKVELVPHFDGDIRNSGGQMYSTAQNHDLASLSGEGVIRLVATSTYGEHYVTRAHSLLAGGNDASNIGKTETNEILFVKSETINSAGAPWVEKSLIVARPKKISGDRTEHFSVEKTYEPEANRTRYTENTSYKDANGTWLRESKYETGKTLTELSPEAQELYGAGMAALILCTAAAKSLNVEEPLDAATKEQDKLRDRPINREGVRIFDEKYIPVSVQMQPQQQQGSSWVARTSPSTPRVDIRQP